MRVGKVSTVRSFLGACVVVSVLANLRGFVLDSLDSHHILNFRSRRLWLEIVVARASFNTPVNVVRIGVWVIPNPFLEGSRRC